MKRCSCCKKELPETEFWKNRSAKDGLQFVCKKCQTMLSSKAYKARIIRSGLMNMVSAYPSSQDDYVFKGIKINILNQTKGIEKMFNIHNLNNGENYTTDDKESFFLRLEKILQRGVA